VIENTARICIETYMITIGKLGADKYDGGVVSFPKSMRKCSEYSSRYCPLINTVTRLSKIKSIGTSRNIGGL